MHVHLHTSALDGVYVEGDETGDDAGDDDVRFVSAKPPTRAEVYVLLDRVAFRVVKWLRKRGYATDDCDYASNDTPKRSFADLLAQVATQLGTVENIKATPPKTSEASTWGRRETPR